MNVNLNLTPILVVLTDILNRLSERTGTMVRNPNSFARAYDLPPIVPGDLWRKYLPIISSGGRKMSDRQHGRVAIQGKYKDPFVVDDTYFPRETRKIKADRIDKINKRRKVDEVYYDLIFM